VKASGYEKRNDFQECEAEFRIAMNPGQHRMLPESQMAGFWN
jgi:IS5 family transposase